MKRKPPGRSELPGDLIVPKSQATVQKEVRPRRRTDRTPGLLEWPKSALSTFLAIAETQQRKRGGQIRVILGKSALARVAPAPVGLLPLLQGFKKLPAPVVFLALGVFEEVFAECVHRLGECMVVVVKPGFAHAGIFLERVMLARPPDCSLDAVVGLANACIQEALQTVVGHRPERAQAAGSRLVRVLVVHVWIISEPPFVVLAGLFREGLIVELAGKILAAADEL